MQQQLLLLVLRLQVIEALGELVVTLRNFSSPRRAQLDLHHCAVELVLSFVELLMSLDFLCSHVSFVLSVRLSFLLELLIEMLELLL